MAVTASCMYSGRRWSRSFTRAFVFPFCVGVDGFSVFEDGFAGFVENLQQLFGAFNHEFHGEIFELKLVIRVS